MEKINVAEILKNCPKGMELDCEMYEDVFFDKITDNQIFPICIRRIDGHPVILTKYGEYANCPSAKCVILPKGKTTWEGFVPPCKFKDGDIIFTHSNFLKRGEGNFWISIFKEKRDGGVVTYVDYAENICDFYSDEDILCMESDILRQRFATEEEKQRLFDAIKANGYKWNAETKTLEKLIEPKFKAGDRIRRKNSNEEYIITTINDYTYYYRLNEHCTGSLGIQLQDEYELVPNKFDITTLVPFESRVLVRDNEREKWFPAFWGFYDVNSDFPYKLIGCIARYCIPYEGNEHLLGNADNCDEFYKT